MHKSGHLGTSLIAYAPVMAILIALDHVLTAGVGLAVAVSLAMLPDLDQRLPNLKHRGASHTLPAVIAVGVVATGLATMPFGLGAILMVGAFTGIDQFIPGLRGRGVVVKYAAPVAIGIGAGVALQSTSLSSIFPFIIGGVAALSVAAHLLGDMLTPTGVKPLWPIRDTKMTLGIVKAANPVANYLLLIVGLVAIGIAGAYGGQLPL